MKSFIVKILVITLAIAVAGWLVFSFFLPEYYLPVLPFVLVFFLIMTTLVHAYQLKLAKKDIAKFTRTNMLVTFFKLVVYSVFAIGYIAYDRENALVFVICLMLIYLIYTITEVSETTKIARKK